MIYDETLGGFKCTQFVCSVLLYFAPCVYLYLKHGFFDCGETNYYYDTCNYSLLDCNNLFDKEEKQKKWRLSKMQQNKAFFPFAP